MQQKTAFLIFSQHGAGFLLKNAKKRRKYGKIFANKTHLHHTQNALTSFDFYKRSAVTCLCAFSLVVDVAVVLAVKFPLVFQKTVI